MPNRPLHVYCADIGSMCDSRKNNNFGWAGRPIAENQEAPWHQGTDMHRLVDHVAKALDQGGNVALGFECPQWVPIRKQPEALTKARKDENRAFTAAAGATSLVTGLVQIPWMLQEIRSKVPRGRAFLDDWESFRQSDCGLFIWEAFVSNKKEETTHIQDAKKAVSTFAESLPALATSVSLPEGSQVYSQIGAELLWAGWTCDLDFLRKSCIVIKA
jgi:hypothetical protein